jgi:hypothetical protein
VALVYLEKALAIENLLSNHQNISDIHLNICVGPTYDEAVLSQLNKHEDAMVNAMNSVILIQDEMLKTALPLLIEHNKEQQRSGGHNLKFGESQSRKKGTLEERLTILSVAYHNYAVELEYLNKVPI